MFPDTIRRLFLPLALLACLAAADATLQTARAVDIDTAWEDYEQLKDATKRSATNDDLRAYLDAVFAAYKEVDKPEKPGPDASEDAKEDYEKAVKKIEKEHEKFRKKARKLFLKVLVITKVQNEVNLRDDMNTKAARILGELAPMLDEKERGDLSKRIQQAIDRRIAKYDHEVSSTHLEAAFEALGKLNDKDSLEWMVDNYSHTKDNEKVYLIAAHKAMPLFTDVPGKLRYEVVDTFIKSYAGVEAQAEQSSSDPKVQAKKRFWDDIKRGVIPVMQYYTRDPVSGEPASNPEGQALAKMSEFQAWFRDHKSTRRPPWVDPDPKD